MAESVLHSFDPARCCGCMACVNACPTKALYMSRDEYGFVVPAIREDLCLRCGKCLSVCPYREQTETNEPIQSFAAVHKQDSVVEQSSSGGLFTALAKVVLDEGGCVFGACMREDFRVEHICVENMEDLAKIRRSKYMQSDLGDTFPQVREKLKTGKSVLFSGTPCQISALLTFLGGKRENLYCVDVVCHGVPSQVFFDDYLRNLSRKEGRIAEYEFRAKKQARNGMNWYFRYRAQGKKPILKNWPEDSFNYFYMKSLIYRDSCYSCRFAQRRRPADLTLCDYWGWEEEHSHDFPAESSVSGCIVYTQKGRELLDKASTDFVCVPADYENIAAHNVRLTQADEMPKERGELLNRWKNEGYGSLDEEFIRTHRSQILKYAVMRKIPESLLGMLSRRKRRK